MSREEGLVFIDTYIIPMAIIITALCVAIVGWSYMLYKDDNDLF